jgi:hypothetical protein
VGALDAFADAARIDPNHEVRNMRILVYTQLLIHRQSA